MVYLNLGNFSSLPPRIPHLLHFRNLIYPPLVTHPLTALKEFELLPISFESPYLAILESLEHILISSLLFPSSVNKSSVFPRFIPSVALSLIHLFFKGPRSISLSISSKMLWKNSLERKRNTGSSFAIDGYSALGKCFTSFSFWIIKYRKALK